MHPPLDRPHPECQDEINGLRECHKSASKLKFWACNEVKDALDKCFREEKKKMLKETIFFNLEEKRQEEYSQAALAFNNKGVTFRESLTTDPIYQKELEKEKKRQNSWFNNIF
jgi:COX assembly protein 2